MKSFTKSIVLIFKGWQLGKCRDVKGLQKDLFPNKEATDAIKEEINKRIPVDRCHIIWATAKRFKCKTCSIKAWCKFKVYNQIAGDLRKRLEIKDD